MYFFDNQGRSYKFYAGEKRYGLIKNCNTCNIEFFAPHCNLKRGWGKYCSRSCSAKSNKGKRYKTKGSYITPKGVMI